MKKRGGTIFGRSCASNCGRALVALSRILAPLCIFLFLLFSTATVRAQRTGNSFFYTSVLTASAQPDILYVPGPSREISGTAVFALSITCPPISAVCSPNGTNYTKTGTDWDATVLNSCGVGTVTVTYSAAGGVSPATGSSFNGAVFDVGIHNITWTATNDCGETQTCTSTITVKASTGPLSASHSTTTVNACVGYNPPDINVTTTGGVLPYSYQWQLNGSAIPGQTSAALTLGPLSTAGTYDYNVVVTDYCGNSITSAVKG